MRRRPRRRRRRTTTPAHSRPSSTATDGRSAGRGPATARPWRRSPALAFLAGGPAGRTGRGRSGRSGGRLGRTGGDHGAPPETRGQDGDLVAVLKDLLRRGGLAVDPHPRRWPGRPRTARRGGLGRRRARRPRCGRVPAPGRYRRPPGPPRTAAGRQRGPGLRSLTGRRPPGRGRGCQPVSSAPFSGKNPTAARSRADPARSPARH